MASSASRRDQLRRQQQEAAARQKRTTRIIGVAVGLLAAVLVGVLVFALVNAPQAPAPTPRAEQVTPPSANADASALVLGRGAPGSPTVTVYLDYQCPNCRIFEEVYGPMLQREAAAGTWTLQNSTMTFLEQALSNTASTRAAVAAACSAFADRYADFNAAIFSHQPANEVRGAVGYTDELLRATIPADLGFTAEQTTALQACYDGRATEDFVAGVDKAAYASGVSATPTLTVDGRPIDLSKARDGSPTR
ncbi:thioredoxin domain-containing protein [Propioniciclava coleopterorum]|uniref:Thioredoxin domain-containing protein n=1 Tax=Propioniciclava coleopterorum TaxID=2714937 RepID=A0A6G7Y3C6_9ACTN|nr:thioredoxin domain-containing protein [Propioniciclava coleopterorum]QIK71148.1 thioredoxin domain-containing protein [Propioniciclava coleopterorum]